MIVGHVGEGSGQAQLIRRAQARADRVLDLPQAADEGELLLVVNLLVVEHQGCPDGRVLRCGIGLQGWPASESGTLCRGDGVQGRGDRRRRAAPEAANVAFAHDAVDGDVSRG